MSGLFDVDDILSDHEEWLKLDEEWGKPIDLDTEDEQAPFLKTMFSTLDLKRTTFDSSFLFKKVRRKIGRQLSKRSTNSYLDYKDFLNDLQNNASRESTKQFYFVNGQIMSAVSVEEICDKIDNYFKSIEKLTVTSTIKKTNVPEVVKCSMSSGDFSFDDTVVGISSTERDSDINRFIDQAFNDFNSSIASMEEVDDMTRESVTTLVRKFSSVLKSPSVNCSPRRRRQCCEKFRDLADFWKKRTLDHN
ncbi:PREDICTED: uncharacterized protein LOC106109266 [Papilio polytes]|uniref:uncharacterized protein LOC106109266 n=1 Tax=Papilio polytes TaxID=76194 RepID=UPI0006765B55|nr:PREDICTED: uncharacterized protein LOC106109266 [Papilio polytes]